MNINNINRGRHAQGRPTDSRAKLISKLLKSGLFVKVDSGFRTNYLKLKDTRYYIVLGLDTSEKEGMKWFYVPEGCSAEDLRFHQYGARSLGKEFIRKTSLEEVFDNVDPDITEKLAFHFNIIPK